MFRLVYTKAVAMKIAELLTRKIPLERAECILFAVLLLAVCFVPYPALAPTHGLHGYLSAHGMTLAAHLSPERHFLMYNHIMVDSAGNEQYWAYNRFPVFPFALIRGAMALGGDDLLAQIVCARKLMLLFWIAAAFCAYLALKRLKLPPLAALTVVLFSFASHCFLEYNDMIFNDVPELFGCMLLFHGLVVHWQENRPRQLLVKALIAIALGWQAYAMLFPAVALLQWKNRRTKENLLLAGAPLLLGVALLTFNLANECIATHTPLLETSTVKSIAYRFGLASDEEYAPLAAELENVRFLRHQFHHLGVASLPPLAEHLIAAMNYALFLHFGVWLNLFGTHDWIWGAIARVLAICALWRGWFPRFPAFCLLALAICWTVPMKHFTFQHDFQAMFFVGVPLMLYGAAFRKIPANSKILPIVAVIAVGTLLTAEFQALEEKIPRQEEARPRLVAMLAIADSLRDESHPLIRVKDIDLERIGGCGRVLDFSLPHARYTTDERIAQWKVFDYPPRIERLSQ